MDLKEVVGKRIRQAREQLGLTQEQLAQRLGKTRNTISSYETGTRILSIAELPDLAEALEVPVSYFFEYDEFDTSEYGRLRKAFASLSPIIQHGLVLLLERAALMQMHLETHAPEMKDAFPRAVERDTIVVLKEKDAVTHFTDELSSSENKYIAFQLRISILSGREASMRERFVESGFRPPSLKRRSEDRYRDKS